MVPSLEVLMTFLCALELSSTLLCTSFSMCSGGLGDGSSIGFQSIFGLIFFGHIPLKEKMEERVVCEDGLGLSGLTVSLEHPFPGSQLGACLWLLYLALYPSRSLKQTFAATLGSIKSPSSTAEEGIWRLGDEKRTEVELNQGFHWRSLVHFGGFQEPLKLYI